MIQDRAYPSFHENQVLTERHLNGVLEYLEPEDRESRILDGSGIRCGLNVTRHEGHTVIELSRGAGTTTKGYLLVNRVPIRYRYFQKLVLPEGSEANYLSHGEAQIKAYELLVDNLDPHDRSEINKNAKAIGPTLTSAPDDELQLTDMVVVLHLAIESADLTTCKIDSCDNEGFENQLRWRALLIAKNDLKPLLKEDQGFSETVQQYFHSKYEVHEARIPVPQFRCRNTQAYAQIHQNYLYICKLGVRHLVDTFGKVAMAYQKVLPELALEFDGGALQDNLTYYEERADGAEAAEGIQYFYDHLKNIALALNEFAHAAFEYHCECSLNQERYPNYLMAGSFRDGQYDDLRDDVYRHYFEPYCRDTAGVSARKELVNLAKRVNALIEAYTTDFIVRSAAMDKSQRLFIAPESRQTNKLGDLVPAYFYSDDSSLPVRWNPKNSARAFRHDAPSYWQRANTDAADWMHDGDSTLRFRLDSHNFYHVEGHLGMSREEFRTAFLKLKRRFNLDIDLELLEAKHVDACEDRHPYDMLHELAEMYDLEKKRIVCYLTKLFETFKDEYKIEEASDGDHPDPDRLQQCIERLEKAYDAIREKFKLEGRFYDRSELEAFVAARKLRCPADTTKTPSYYVVDLRTISEGGEVDVGEQSPCIIERPGHHGGHVNVLYTNGSVKPLKTDSAEYRVLLEQFGPTEDDITVPSERPTPSERDDFRPAPVGPIGGFTDDRSETVEATVPGEEPAGEADWANVDAAAHGLRRASADESSVPTEAAPIESASPADKPFPATSADETKASRDDTDTLALLDAVIENETDSARLRELKKIWGAIIGGKYASATEEEKKEISLDTITVVDQAQNYVFYDYDASVAAAFGQGREIQKLLNMLAGLIYKTRKAIRDDDIEADDGSIKDYLKDLESLSRQIADLVEGCDATERETEIRKCLILPMIVGIFQRCWAASFLNIKRKYVDAQASIREPVAFPHFVHKHPGIRHVGGAPAGGTLVVVFKAYDESSLYDTFDEILLPRGWHGYTSRQMEAYEDYVAGLGSGLTDVAVDRNEIIVADFCLPYRCRASATSVEYVVLVDLELNVAEEVCNTTERLPITFSPESAVLSGEHVARDPDDGLFSFHSGGLTAGPYEIQLSLSNKTLKKTVIVFVPPGAEYTAEVPAPSAGEDTWTFRADESGMGYNWFRRDLGAEDGVSAEINDAVIENGFTPVGASRVYTQRVEPDEPLDFELVLRVVNGPCRVYSTARRFTYTPLIEWSLSPTRICNGEDAVPLLYEPIEATLAGLDGLEGKVKSSDGGYVLQANGIPAGDYTIQMSLSPHDPFVFDIEILQSPTATFDRTNVEPEDLGDGRLSWTFVAVTREEGYEYQWYWGGEALSGEAAPEYTHTWDKRMGTDGRLTLEVTADICTSSSEMDVRYDAVEEEEASITFDETVCADSGSIRIEYSPAGATVTGETHSSTYVEFNSVNGDAYFNTAGLDPQKKYPIRLWLDGEKKAEQLVSICASPDLTFSENTSVHPNTGRHISTFASTTYTDSHEYFWYPKGQPAHGGPKYVYTWPLNVNASLSLQLEVKTQECSPRSPVRVFLHPAARPLNPENLRRHLENSLAVFAGNSPAPDAIRENALKILDTNSKILESLEPASPDVDPEAHALAAIKQPAMTGRIGLNLENMSVIVDKLPRLDISREERKNVETLLKATLASTAEILLGRTKDLDASTNAHQALVRLTPRVKDLFTINYTDEAKTNLMVRVRGKPNIVEFIKVVERL